MKNKLSILVLGCWVLVWIPAGQLCGQSQQHNIQGTDISAAVLAHSQAAKPAPFSWEQIMQKPAIKQVKLAPNGQHLAYLQNEARGLTLWLLDVERNEHELLLHTTNIKNVRWSRDSQGLYLESAQNMAYLDLQAEVVKPELFVQFDRKRAESFYAYDSSQPGHVLIRRELKEQGNLTQHQLIRVSLKGEQTLLYSGSSQVYDHLFDAQGELAFIRIPGDQRHEIYRIDGDEKQLVFSASVVDKIEMVRFDETTDELILVGHHDADLISLHAYDIKKASSRVLHQDPEGVADLRSLVLDDDSGQLLMASYFSDHNETYAIDPAMQTGLDLITASLQGSVAVQANLDTPHWLVTQWGAHIGHPKYHLYDVEKQQLAPVLAAQRQAGMMVAEEQLPQAIPVSYQASDGMMIHGYVMLPKGLDLQQVPLLVQVHGGPFNRSHGGASPWQYLVNQGYAMFIPNFRASKGYGMAYMTAGKAQFSTRVQLDIIEGVNYLLSQGIGQPGQIGVFGHSFGGFSVLALLSSYPEFFTAGFASAAPTELLNTLFKLDKKDINRYDGIPLLAALPILMVDFDDEQQKANMNHHAPAALWQNITKPLMIWAGAKDERVPIVDVRDHASRLKNAGKAVELVVDEQTGHNFHPDDEIGRRAFRFLTEDFFAKHFNKSRPTADAATRDYLKKYTVY